MKASRFSDAQKAFILKQAADGMPVAEICRKAGISQATFFNWKRKYDGLLPTALLEASLSGATRLVVIGRGIDPEHATRPSDRNTPLATHLINQLALPDRPQSFRRMTS